MQNAQPVTMIALEDLRFDRANPRLLESEIAGRVTKSTEEDIGRALWRELHAEEITMSIVAAGAFFSHEPLMVERDGRKGSFTVIEGNRRLVAVKAIVDPDFRREIGAERFEAFQDVTPKLRESLTQLPCIISTREGLWQFLGFKHVNGSKPWGSFSKAEFIAHVHEQQGVRLQEIARQIGDRNSTVERLYRGWAVLRQAQEADLFRINNRAKKRFAFSHLYTGLEYPNIQAFLGIPPDAYETRKPVKRSNLENLKDLMLWLFGSSEPAVEPVVERQNPDLKDLETALAKPSGVKALKAGVSLRVARDASLGDKRIFDDALSRAITALKDANAVCSTGPEGKLDELESAEQAVTLAGAIVSAVEGKIYGKRRLSGRVVRE
jgi:hypothetical protein